MPGRRGRFEMVGLHERDRRIQGAQRLTGFHSNAVYPYCGAYSFYGGTYLYNCNPTVQSVTSVEFLNDFYETAIGSTVGPDSSAILPFTDGITQAAASTTSTDSTSTPFGGSSSSDDEDQQSDNGLSTAAIDGIAVACSLVGAVILGVLAFFLVRSRKKKRWAAAQAQAGNAPGGPPMQPYPQQVYSVPGKSPDGNYQPGFSPPQTDGTVPMTPAPQYSTPPPQTQSPYYPPPSQPGSPLPGTMTQSSAYSPSNYTSGAPPTITDPNTLSPNPAASTNPPSMYSASGTMDTRQSYYQPPHSPYTQEVDATLGNPSIPVGGAAPTASAANPREVDATSGNPGMPHEGSGIPPLQGLPGGSPSSTEIEGRNVSGGLNAAAADGNHTPGGIAPGTGPIGPGGPPQGGLGSSLNAPWSDHGPYEMGTDRERL